jgi:hypothetical protein
MADQKSVASLEYIYMMEPLRRAKTIRIVIHVVGTTIANLLTLLPDLYLQRTSALSYASMEAQLTDEELQQLLQELRKIPPDNLPVDDIHPF